MSYTVFSRLYENLIYEDINYSRITDFIENVFDRYNINPSLVLDLACGTGGVTFSMAKRGYDMIGVDRSSDMLNIAAQKNKDQKILFLKQNMTHLDLYGTVGAALCMTDGFNYILSDKDLLDTLSRLNKCFLDPGAVLIFDVSSEYKLKNTMGNNTFVYDTDDLFYVWENKYYKTSDLLDLSINFFKKEDKRYKKIKEHQVMRARSKERIEYILKKAGFSDILCFSSTEFAPYKETAERLFITAKTTK